MKIHFLFEAEMAYFSGVSTHSLLICFRVRVEKTTGRPQGGLGKFPGAEAIPRNFGAMFRFNAAVMGVAKQDWMYEAETRWSGNGGDGMVRFSHRIKVYVYPGPLPEVWG